MLLGTQINARNSSMSVYDLSTGEESTHAH